ncbi:hypothetical protein F0U61_15280 [Archangium violaceum]|uniref:hypothetical protein n=1 Tax=Archangium violaceum TaxID=83451 RepID=UPI002B28986E|nr:hypothetical protein F0U61_15280 [Archangium violaceum]
MRALLLTLTLLLSAPVSSALAAEDSTWSATFSAESLATWLDAPPARYLLVPAGAESPALTQAEQALATALRASGKASLVMDAQALGPVTRSDDATIVQRGAGFPVDRVLVLRLFPDASGEQTQAVVTVYDTTGQTRGAFSATRGTALEPRTLAAPEPAPSKPVPSMPTPSKPVPPSAPSMDPVEQYEQQYIGFDEFIAVNAGTHAVVSQHTVPYEGKFKKPLRGDTFYQKVGRADLVEAYQGKMTLKTVLGVVGVGAIAGGIVAGVTGANANQSEDCFADRGYFEDTSACFDRNWERADRRREAFLTGFGISAAGIGVLIAAIFINPHPVTPSEARELADGYNKKLRSDLGLSDDGKPVTPARAPSSIQARFSPVFRADGGGLLLSGTF